MKNETTGSPAPVTTGRRPSIANTVKLCVRLVDPINFPLRNLVQYQGQLTSYIVEAIESVDLATVPLLAIRDVRGKDTTIRVSEPLFERLAALSKERGASVNMLINTAVGLWLEEKRKKRGAWRK